MTLYHASRTQLSVGKMSATHPCTTYPEAVTALEKSRPSDKPSRLICLFATDSVISATAFIASENVKGFWIYEVKMEGFHKAPFCITHEIEERIKSGKPFDKLVEEYWNPKEDWYFSEYFGPTFQIVQQVPPADNIELATFHLSYDKDRLRAINL
jgi:hypothetical protein